MVDEATLKGIRQMLGYSDAQWETFKGNPRNLLRFRKLFG